MGQIKRLIDDILTEEEFDILFDEEYENWKKQKQNHDQILDLMNKNINIEKLKQHENKG